MNTSNLLLTSLEQNLINLVLDFSGTIRMGFSDIMPNVKLELSEEIKKKSSDVDIKSVHDLLYFSEDKLSSYEKDSEGNMDEGVLLNYYGIRQSAERLDVEHPTSSWTLFGEFIAEPKPTVVIYYKAIEDAVGKDKRWTALIPVFIHEMIHARNYFLSGKKTRSVPEIDEAMVEFATARFLKSVLFRTGEAAFTECVFWHAESLRTKKNSLGLLPAYGFGDYLQRFAKPELLDVYSTKSGSISKSNPDVAELVRLLNPVYPVFDERRALTLLESILHARISDERERYASGGMVTVDYTPGYSSFGDNDRLHIDYDPMTDEIICFKTPMYGGNIKVVPEGMRERYRSFLRDPKNVYDFFDDTKAYSSGQALQGFIDASPYKLSMTYGGRTKTISVGGVIPYKHPFAGTCYCVPKKK